jgi:2-isopropylmalate synthase
MTREEVLKRAVEAVHYSKKFTHLIEFGAEDAARSDREFLVQVLEAVIEAGADIVNIPDTVGYMTPDEYGDLIAYVKKNVKGIEKAIISVHCHNDLGLAVANSLSGVKNGAGQIECTVNGIGERAGNAALEEVVMALKTKQKYYQSTTKIHTQSLVSTSRLLSRINGHPVPSNKAIVGKNAFVHGAGIHQHGMLSSKETYEIMDPEDVGFESNEIILSKHSGKHALRHRLEALGINIEGSLDDLFEKFKLFAGRKKYVEDKDLLHLVSS